MASVKKKIVRNTVATSLLKGWKYIISFALFPFIINHVGSYDYGLYLLVGAFVGYFGLLDLGVSQALIKYVAQYNATDDKEKINEMVNSTFFFYLGIGLIISISTIIIGTFYTSFFDIESSQIEKARLIAYLVAIGAFSSWPMISLGTVLRGMQRYDINAMLGFVTSTATAIATVIILLMGYGIIELILIGIIIGSIGHLISILIIQKLYPYLSISTKYMKKETLKKILKFSSVVFVIQISVLVILGTDRILVGGFVGVGAITFYAIARKLHDLVMTVPKLLTSAILPAASEMEAQNRSRAIDKLIIRGGKYSCAAAFSFAIVIFFMADPIIRFWMGSDEFISMAFVSQVFVLYFFFNVGGMTEQVLLAKEKFKPILIFVSINMVANFIISFILVQRIGVMGVVLGTVLPMVILLPVYVYWSLKILNVDIKAYVKTALLPNYVLTGITGIALFILVNLITFTNLFTVAAVCFLGLAIYFGLFYLLFFNKEEKQEIWFVFKG